MRACVRVLRARAVACVRPPRRRRPGERGLGVIRDASELTLGRGVSRPLASRARSYMFRDAAAFNADLSEWNTGSVTDMGFVCCERVALRACVPPGGGGRASAASASFAMRAS